MERAMLHNCWVSSRRMAKIRQWISTCIRLCTSLKMSLILRISRLMTSVLSCSATDCRACGYEVSFDYHYRRLRMCNPISWRSNINCIRWRSLTGLRNTVVSQGTSSTLQWCRYSLGIVRRYKSVICFRLLNPVGWRWLDSMWFCPL